MKAIWLPGMLSLLLGGCAASGSESGRALPPKARFASLGSSFAAGAGIGPLQAGTPERCSRTTNNYATLLAARLDLNLVDASCGGATSEHVLRGWSELPPQIDALDRETRLVTITVGGNDLGYVGWLFASSCRLGVAAFPALADRLRNRPMLTMPGLTGISGRLRSRSGSGRLRPGWSLSSM